MMTLKRNHDGGTEIKFPIGNTKFIRETQKLFNKYFSEENSADINTQPTYSKFDSPNLNAPSTSKNSGNVYLQFFSLFRNIFKTIYFSVDNNKRLKSTPSTPNKTLPRAEIKSTDYQSREKNTAGKDLLNENTKTENVKNNSFLTNHIVL